MESNLISMNPLDECLLEEKKVIDRQKEKRQKEKELHVEMKKVSRKNRQEKKRDELTKKRKKKFYNFLTAKLPTTYERIICNIEAGKISGDQLKRLKKQSFWWNLSRSGVLGPLNFWN